MSRLVIKMVYAPNVFHAVQRNAVPWVSDNQLQIRKERSFQSVEGILSKNFNESYLEDDHEEFKWTTLFLGIIPFAIGLQFLVSSLFLPEIKGYREVYILLTLVGLISLNSRFGRKNDDETSLGN